MAIEHGDTLNRAQILKTLERLTGQDAPFSGDVPEVVQVFEPAQGGLGYSQLNELLLLFGFDRITHAFFRFLLDGSTDYKPGDAFSSPDQLESGITNFRKIALLLYGNVKFAFKSLSRDANLLVSVLGGLEPLPIEVFASRHSPILPVHPIPAEDAYLTGYMIERELKDRIARDALDETARELECKRVETVERARKNHQAYLASDHLDVYVATSMREAHEFLSVNRLTSAIFGHESVRPLNLRWFDPTQSYCADRIDKGLAEALMLRRATCTVYLAQENDTLGKDSELASTLAQGKPVIAYLPNVDDSYIDEHLKLVQAAQATRDLRSIMLDQLRLFDPSAAWTDDEVRDWCKSPSTADINEVKSRLGRQIKRHYDGRARTLRDSHPLGIQVHLETGVANGVLVVRNVADCANLIRRIVTRTLELELEEKEAYTLLREKLSGCVFRVMTADSMLTNTFWNFYLDPAE